MAEPTYPPKKRGIQYRDPTLSDRWLNEAQARAKGQGPMLTHDDACKIILRLVREVKNINRETGR